MFDILNHRIPQGPYCYNIIKVDNDKIKTCSCPFWKRVADKPEQENGYCHLLKIGDWDNSGVSLLWDQVKECEINL